MTEREPLAVALRHANGFLVCASRALGDAGEAWTLIRRIPPEEAKKAERRAYHLTTHHPPRGKEKPNA